MATILVVDDHPDNREFLVFLLGSQGHRLLEAADGEEALALVHAAHPDLVITDILMPRMTGDEFVRRLRSDPAVAATLVIFSTATYQEREARALAQACGVAHLLTKPSEPEVVLRMVAGVLGLDSPAPPTSAPGEGDPEALPHLAARLVEKVNELEAANQRLKALVDLGRQLALENDTPRLLQCYCEAAREIIVARYVAVALLGEDGTAFRYFSISGLDERAVARLPTPSPDLSLFRDVLSRRRPVRVRDLATEPGAAGLAPPHPRQGAFLGVAIASSSRLYGLLYLVEKVGIGEFTEEDEQTALTLATQLGVAYRGALQYEEIRRDTARLEEEVRVRRQAEEALREAREFLTRLLDHTPAAIYVTTSEGRRSLVNRAWEQLWRRSREEVIGRTLEEVFPPELARHFQDQNRQVLETGAPLVYEEEVAAPDGRHVFYTVKFPLRDSTGRIEAVGGISIDITERKRAEEAVREYADRLQVLSRRVVEVQEEERRHLARELHDEIGQVLSAVSINLHAVLGLCDPAARPRLEESITIVDRAIEQVRNLSLDLRPSMLDVLGLVPTLRWYADRQAQRTGFALHFAATPSEARLPADLETACYRVVQEALTNVARHARARQVWLELQTLAGEVRLVIRDDGVGFDPAAVRQRAARGASFGVLGMQERVELLGGRLDVDSGPGLGTTIRVRFPILSPPSPDAG